ncbi:hypothetical protein AGLY_017501 [Aphis glycines]|uniref:SWIM-type domain-containing protein n=1 Tax=Aphis glycines TaxID=307491 RepID=A0A6G0SUS5_APHGL|nr:hypothetical protein AGLY_017501 [Aphis glycines]
MYYVSSSTQNSYYTVRSLENYEFCDCPAGQGGAFCKHICAIHLNGFVVQNNPHLSFSDHDQLGELAVGKNFDSSFLQSMDIDNVGNIEFDTTSYTSRGASTTTAEFSSSANCNPVELEDQSDTLEKIKSELIVLQGLIDRIKQMADENSKDPYLLKHLKKLNKNLKNITTVTSFVNVTNHFISHKNKLENILIFQYATK